MSLILEQQSLSKPNYQQANSSFRDGLQLLRVRKTKKKEYIYDLKIEDWEGGSSVNNLKFIIIKHN